MSLLIIRRTMPRSLLVLLPILALSFSSCVHKKGAGAGGGADGDSVNGTALPDRQEGVSFMSSNVDRHRFHPVYFEFDSFQIRPQDREKIREIAAFVKSEGKTVIIAGFTDERGTPEY